MKQLESRPFTLIGVNTNARQPQKLKELMDRELLPWRSFADNGEIVRRWNLAGTPTMYLIDQAGVIRGKWVGAPGEKVLEQALEKWIAEAEKAGDGRSK